MSSGDDKPGGFAAMLEEYDEPIRKRRPRMGDEVTARIVAVSSESLFVDLGAKAEGVLDRSEFVDEDGKLTVAVGDEVTARVADTSGGVIVLRTKVGRGADAASELALAHSHGLPVEGTVTAVNKGGVEVDIGNVRAFCPVSQLDAGYVEDAATYVGKKLEFRVTKYEEGRGGKPNIVVSRKALMQEANAKRAEETRAKLEVGAVVSGTVSTIKDYGAFVDLGGLEGMLHISELGFERVKHPSDVLTVGATIEVLVQKIEKSDDPKRRERISLSLKALESDPWEGAVDKIAEGQHLTGEVVRMEPFGAFVALEHGVEGLVHIGEIGASKRLHHARDALSIGQKVEVVVLGVDRERKRIALSMKQVGAQQEAQQAKDYKPRGGSMGTLADLFKGKK